MTRARARCACVLLCDAGTRALNNLPVPHLCGYHPALVALQSVQQALGLEVPHTGAFVFWGVGGGGRGEGKGLLSGAYPDAAAASWHRGELRTWRGARARTGGAAGRLGARALGAPGLPSTCHRGLALTVP